VCVICATVYINRTSDSEVTLYLFLNVSLVSRAAHVLCATLYIKTNSTVQVQPAFSWEFGDQCSQWLAPSHKTIHSFVLQSCRPGTMQNKRHTHATSIRTPNQVDIRYNSPSRSARRHALTVQILQITLQDVCIVAFYHFSSSSSLALHPVVGQSLLRFGISSRKFPGR
jgi:hypothetical protein